jgi:3-oxoacyl-[acyl-carrier-protein] synthase-3
MQNVMCSLGSCRELRQPFTSSSSSSIRTWAHRRCLQPTSAAAVQQGVRLMGSGSSVPEKFLTNDDLAKLVDTNDDWITTRTGIRKRHVLAEGESLSAHAAIAGQRALEMAGACLCLGAGMGCKGNLWVTKSMSSMHSSSILLAAAAGVAAGQLDLIILATSSPDDLFGSACMVQELLGAKNAACFDLTAACSGFVMALITGTQFVRAGAYKNVLVIGADALSRYVDWRDRGRIGAVD